MKLEKREPLLWERFWMYREILLSYNENKIETWVGFLLKLQFEFSSIWAIKISVKFQTRVQVSNLRFFQEIQAWTSFWEIKNFSKSKFKPLRVTSSSIKVQHALNLFKLRSFDPLTYTVVCYTKILSKNFIGSVWPWHLTFK